MCDQVHTLFQLDPTILYTHNPMAMGGFALRVQRNTSTVSQPSPKFDDGRSDSLEADTLDMSRPGPIVWILRCVVVIHYHGAQRYHHKTCSKRCCVAQGRTSRNIILFFDSSSRRKGLGVFLFVELGTAMTPKM